MDIRKIFNIFKRWVWLLILGGVLAGVGGYIVSSRQTPVIKPAHVSWFYAQHKRLKIGRAHV